MLLVHLLVHFQGEMLVKVESSVAQLRVEVLVPDHYLKVDHD